MVAYCEENKVSYNQRLAELGINAWNFYDAKRNMLLSGGVAGIVESDGFLAPGRTCDFGRLRPLALHRVPPAGPACGLFRGDGFGDEYGGGVCRGFDFGGGEEGGGWAEKSSDW